MEAMDQIRATRGLMAKTAKALGITRAAVVKWRQVPPARVHAVSRVTGLPPHRLRPDLFPEPERAK